MCGNTTDPGDASVWPGKSSLFFLTSMSYLGNGLSGEKEEVLAKHSVFWSVLCAHDGP